MPRMFLVLLVAVVASLFRPAFTRVMSTFPLPTLSFTSSSSFLTCHVSPLSPTATLAIPAEGSTLSMTFLGYHFGRPVYIDYSPASVALRASARGNVPMPRHALNSRRNADIGVSAALAPLDFTVDNPGIPRPFDELLTPVPIDLPPVPEPPPPANYTAPPPAPRPVATGGPAPRMLLTHALVVPTPPHRGPICLEAEDPASPPPPELAAATSTEVHGGLGALVPGLFVDYSPEGFAARRAVLMGRYGPGYRPQSWAIRQPNGEVVMMG